MDSGSTAWVLTSTALVLLMVPGLALFYGGMVGAKRVINMVMMTFGAAIVVCVIWVLYGYSLAFGDSIGGAGILGLDTANFGLGGVIAEDEAATIPPALFAVFQMLFAALTTALIAGGVADRMKFGVWLAFTAVWATLVYLPVAHWVFAFDSDTVVGGWIANDVGAIDFAGGTAVHINAGIAALAVVIVLGKRTGWPSSPHKPHNLPLTALGAGLLWFGWLGFNGGSALAAGNSASVVVLNTVAAASAAGLAWIVVERFRGGAMTSLGKSSGIVAGLVAITPACGAVNPLGALIIGAVAGALCALAVNLKYKLGYDDSLDVVGVHLVGGIIGTLLIGFLATADAPNERDGLFFGGGVELLLDQTIAAVAVLAYSFVLTFIIAKLFDLAVGLRVSAEVEQEGIDSVHRESGYDFLGPDPVAEPEPVKA
ncbi:ammonium transporter [Catenuloplanes indicus]|uniref:Ammonium transporter n=1 Tax=Catenuloplanes indicus TaxID=137267 RepID=A0AAE4B1H4_9ACTN|nr:ammonium transporter [Catenuloplanes indicus]MDQ0370622.1 Amt family ammonium transporter [Catenuloplanes indicus]